MNIEKLPKKRKTFPLIYPVHLIPTKNIFDYKRKIQIKQRLTKLNSERIVHLQFVFAQLFKTNQAFKLDFSYL